MQFKHPDTAATLEIREILSHLIDGTADAHCTQLVNLTYAVDKLIEIVCVLAEQLSARDQADLIAGVAHTSWGALSPH